MQSQSDTVQNLRIKKNLHFYIYKEKEHILSKIHIFRYKQLHFRFNFRRIRFIRIFEMKNLKFCLILNLILHLKICIFLF